MADNNGPQVYSPQSSSQQPEPKNEGLSKPAQPQSPPIPPTPSTPPQPLESVPSAPVTPPVPPTPPAQPEHGVSEPTTFPQGNPFSDGGSSVPPPPPSPEERVGVRTMNSDMESVKQTGGSAPQPEIVNAPTLSSQQPSPIGGQPSSPASMSSTPTVPHIEQSVPQPVGQPASVPSPAPMSSDAADDAVVSGKSKFSMKTIGIIVGIVVLAVAVGFGVYYLVSSLNTTPELPAPPSGDNNLPLSDLNDIIPPASQDETPAEPAFVHQSIFLSPDDVSKMMLEGVGQASFEAAIASSSQLTLPAGSVREMQLTVDDIQTPASSRDVLGAYFPSVQLAAAPYMAQDVTMWLYFDDVGVVGPRLGVAMPLNAGVDVAQATSTISQAIEVSLADIPEFFVSSVTPKPSATFDDGVVEGTPVRFVVYDTGRAFEYGWISYNNTTYLVMATSYGQMVDVLERTGVAVPQQ